MAIFNIVKNGYHTDEVDNHIRALEKTLDEYKEKDAAIANAMINAQIAADNIIKNADLAARSIRQEAIDHLDKISGSLDKQRRLVARFERDYDELVEKYLHRLNSSDFKNLLVGVDELEKYLDALKNNGDDSASTEEPGNSEVE